MLKDISLNINKQEKIGLIGPNGSGKSTLFSMILGDTEPSQGSIRVNKNTHIGYLPQESSFKSEHTVLAEIIEFDSRIMVLKREKEELEEKNQAASGRYGEILHELDTLGYFEMEYKAKKVLMGLGFKERDFIRSISQMSGGWQMRTLLAKLLVFPYDLLLLDEPTNYLDLNAALWLKDYLAYFKGTFIMISHDKAFLNEVTNYTLILENGEIFKVQGNYEHYERIKSQRRTFLLRQFKEQEKKRQQLETYIARFHAQPNKASSVRAKRTALEKIQEIVVPPDPRESIGKFSFPGVKRSGHKAITLNNISKSYPEVTVYKDLSFEVVSQEKAVLAGENGAGKSTLLKILAGVVDIDSGERIVGHNIDIGYFSQTRMDVLNERNTVLEEAYSAALGYMPQETIRTILGAFLFTGDDVEKSVSVLSGGEKSRLILAKLLINPPNLLLLDEPTTHLDVDAVDVLVNALQTYNGTIVFISHDIHFVRSVANTVFEVKNGTVRKFPGSFDYYLEKKDAVTSVMPKVRKEPKPEDSKLKEEKERLKKELVQKREEERKRKAYNEDIGRKIKKLEAEKEKLSLESYAKSRALSDTRIYRDEETVKNYGRRLKEIQEELSRMDKEIDGLIAKLL